jgi:hypothetical protein
VQYIILKEDGQKTSFSFTINSDKGYSATIVEKTEPVVEGSIPPMIAQVEIFQEGEAENQIWAIFKRTSGGDPILL